MKIAIYLPSMVGGGAEKVMLILAKGFSQRGYEVDLVLASATGAYLEQVPSHINIVDLKSTRVISSLPGLVQYLRASRPDVLLSAMEHANTVAFLAGKISKIPLRIFASVHQNLSFTKKSESLRDKLTQYWIRPFYPKLDGIVAVSQGVADELSEMIQKPLPQLHVIYNPVVTTDLKRRSLEPIEHPWFQPEQPPVIIGVGRLVLNKDFSTLISAFVRVRKTQTARLVIFGEGAERQNLQALINCSEFKEDISIHGFVDNPYPYMAAAELFVLSSVREGFGNVLVEAMACGTKVVSTTCPGGPREILEGGRWGELVPVADIDALASSISLQLSSSPVEGMKDSVFERFHEDVIVKQYLELLEEKR